MIDQTPGRYATNGLLFHPFTVPPTAVPQLPVGSYVIKQNPDTGAYYLEVIKNFTLPAKIYGNNNNYAQTIFNTFTAHRVGKITSAVLSGLKGSGKTLTAKQISLLGIAAGIPTLVLDQAFTGPDFVSFLTHIKVPFILFVDEFEKVFHKETDLNKLLSMLDGTMQAHMLCIMTMNSSLNDDRFQFFKNRPGRVYYNIHYPTITTQIVKEYLADNLTAPINHDLFLTFLQKFQAMTVDLLSVLVTELNLNPTAGFDELCHILNIKPDTQVNDDYYDLSVVTPAGKLLDYVALFDNLSYKPKYKFIQNLLTYNMAEFDYNACLGTPEFELLERLFKNREFTLNHNSYVTYDTMDDLSERVLKSTPELSALSAQTANSEYYSVIGRYTMTFKLNLAILEKGGNSEWIFEVDYAKRLLSLTNTIFNFKVLLQGKQFEEKRKFFLL